MTVMSPRVVLGTVNPDGSPPLPQSLGGVPVWSARHECTIGTRPAWEFRHAPTGRLVVVQHVAATELPGGASGAVWVAWVPSDLRDGENTVFESLAAVLTALGVLFAHWPCEESAGDLLCTALETDPSLAAAVVRDVWPTTWRQWAEGDEQGDPFAVPPVPRGVPSGAMILGEVVA